MCQRAPRFARLRVALTQTFETFTRPINRLTRVRMANEIVSRFQWLAHQYPPWAAQPKANTFNGINRTRREADSQYNRLASRYFSRSARLRSNAHQTWYSRDINSR